MLPITLEPKPQINLFPKHSNNASSFELEVVNGDQFSEIHLYFLTDKKEKTAKPRKKKSAPKYETIFLF
jgi:hypothetical protein